MHKIIFFLLLTLLFATAENEFAIDVSYARFLNEVDNSKIDLEIYISFPLKNLAFSQNPEQTDIFDAAYLVKVWLNDLNQDYIYQNPDQNPHFAVVHSLDEITESTTAIELVRMSVPPGNYKLQVGIIDANTKKMGVKEEENLTLAAFPKNQLTFSDLELANSAEPVSKAGSSLVKKGYFIVPNASNAFAKDKDKLIAYFEIYNLPKEYQNKEIPVSFDLDDAAGKLVDNKSFTYTQEGENGFFIGAMSISNLIPAKYLLSIAVGNKEKPMNTYQREIFVSSSKVEPSTAGNDINDEMAAIIRDEIRLIATDKELKLWDQLGPSQRADFLKAFWMRRDPNQENPQVDNSFRRKFYERLKYVDENYAFLNIRGRDSDQGRVYLTYGKPDEVTRDPLGISSMVGIDTSSWTTKGAVAWAYDSLGSGNTKIYFVFVDQNGDGIFRLYSSNLKGWSKYQPTESEGSGN
jgi:GWxTD domain-containing protein